MKKLISFMHISLDGFVAGPNGEMDWIKINQEIFDHVEKRIGATNEAMYGRATFQMMEAYWPTAADKPNATSHDKNHSKWYKEAGKIVLSKTLNEKDFSKTKIISDNLLEEINAIKKQNGNEILLFGSPTTTHALIQQNLIDGYWLFVNPIILGNGIPLFKDVKEKISLKLLSTKQFECGVVELKYDVEK